MKVIHLFTQGSLLSIIGNYQQCIFIEKTKMNWKDSWRSLLGRQKKPGTCVFQQRAEHIRSVVEAHGGRFVQAQFREAHHVVEVILDGGRSFMDWQPVKNITPATLPRELERFNKTFTSHLGLA